MAGRSDRLLWGGVWAGVLLAAAGLYVFLLPDTTGVTRNERRFIEREIEATLRDPESARFEFTGGFGAFVCGSVNAKNGFGAYAGKEKFVADVRAPSKVYRTDSAPLISDLESQIGKGSDLSLKQALARCEGGFLDYFDKSGKLHVLDRDGKEFAP